VNLTKYVSEAVASILLESKKMTSSDVKPLTEVCMKLHLMYADFGAQFVAAVAKCMGAVGVTGPGALDKSIMGKKMGVAAGGKEDEGMVMLAGMKKRTVLKVLMELAMIGVEPKKLLEILRVLVGDLSVACATDGKDAFQAKLSLLVSFAKHAPAEFLGAANGAGQGDEQETAGDREAAFVPETISKAQQSNFRSAVHSAFTAASSLLIEEHTALFEMEEKNAHEISIRGELREEDSALYEKARKAYEAMQRSVSALSEILDEAMP